MDIATLTTLAGIVEYAVPVVFASIGENISEKAGVINLSVNGIIILSGMGGFVVALNTNSLLLGFLTGALIGAAVAAIVAFSSITLKQSQVAIGFVLALLCRDLAYFLGAPFTNKPGIFLSKVPIPGLVDISDRWTDLFQSFACCLCFLSVHHCCVCVYLQNPSGFNAARDRRET